MKALRALLILIAVVSFSIAISYPIRYHLAEKDNNDALEALSAMRQRVQNDAASDAEEGAEEGTRKEAAPDQASLDDTAEGSASAAERKEREAADEDPAKLGTPEDLPEASEMKAGNSAVSQASATKPTPTANAAAEGTPAEDRKPQGEGSVENFAAPAASPKDGDEPARTTFAPIPVKETEDASGENVSLPQTIEPERREDPERAQILPPAASPTALAIAQEASLPETDTPASASAAPPGVAPVMTPNAGQASITASPQTSEAPAPTAAAGTEPTPEPTPGIMDLILDDIPGSVAYEEHTAPADGSGNAPAPSPTPDRHVRTGALPYPEKQKVELDEEKILPELREIYQLNHDTVGWICIPDTVIDYPVLQADNGDYYLKHDFYGKENSNGQILLDAGCDPYTPGYNLVISGHHMRNGSMFGSLTDYRSERFWQEHRFVEFDTLMERKSYVVFAAFYSADYDEDEEGFRYSANIEYRTDAVLWLEQIRENQLYETGVDAEFGDEFITLTTCTHTHRKDGRFVVVCRRIREGEEFS